MVFLVVVIHSGLVYEMALDSSWIVSDPVKNDNIGLVRLILDVFVMFTFFFISGYFMPSSTKRKSTMDFIISKLKRIMLPWFIAVLTLIPIYKMIFLYSRSMPQEEWVSYFHWFTRAGGNPYLFSDNPVQNWLWFLPVLFLFQLVYLVLSKTKLNLNISFKTGVILTVIFGVFYSMAISTVGLTGWHHSVLFHFQRERFLVYFLVFFLGALAKKENIFGNETRNIIQIIWVNIILFLALTVYIITILNLFFNMITPGREFYFVSIFWDKLVMYLSLIISMLSFLYIWIDLFRYKFNKTNVLLAEMSRNSYYVYVIHMIIIGVVALAFLNFDLPAFVKFIVVSILSFVGSHAIILGVRKLV